MVGAQNFEPLLKILSPYGIELSFERSNQLAVPHRIKKRRSIRLSGFDYSQGGCYFITICTKFRLPFFSKISDCKVFRSKIGQLAHNNWEKIPEHYLNADLDEFVVMPNHIHGLIWLNEANAPVGAQNFEPLRKANGIKHEFQKIIPSSIGSIVRAYKASVKQWCNLNEPEEFGWQRNYHERIIRNERELLAVREYIINNPANWEKDEYHIC